MFWEDPFEDIERARRRLRRLMEIWGPMWESMPRFREFPVDIAEVEDELIIRANLPGFDKGDIKIRATENTIEIAASKKEEKREKTETMFRAERKMGALRRAFTLPTEVDPDTAKTSFERGVLEIRLKKKKPAKKTKEIKVE